MRRRLPLHVTAALALTVVPLLSSCGLFGDDDPAASSAPSTTVVTTTTVPASSVEVLEPGRAPLVPLRLQFREGDTTKVALTIDLSVDQTSGTSHAELAAPAVREVATLTVDGVRRGEAMVSLTFDEATVVRDPGELSAEEADAIDRGLAALTDVRGSGRISEFGELSAFRYDLPEGLDPGVRTTLEGARGQLDALALPLPAEPVGVGARWRSTTTSRVGGFPLRQETTYEITGIQDGSVTYRAEIRQYAQDQPVALDDLPPGTTAHLVSSRLTGTATGTMDLTSVAATARSSLAGTQVIDLRGNGQKNRLTQELSLAVVVKPA